MIAPCCRRTYTATFVPDGNDDSGVGVTFEESSLGVDGVEVVLGFDVFGSVGVNGAAGEVAVVVAGVAGTPGALLGPETPAAPPISLQLVTGKHIYHSRQTTYHCIG